MINVDSLYLHFPFCKQFCPYCDFYSQEMDEQQLEAFLNYLKVSREQLQDFYRQHKIGWKKLETLYLGGGTPSLWGRAGAEFLQRFIGEEIGLSETAEVTLEINPGAFDIQDLDAWRRLGVNRVSVGVQSLDREVLSRIGRIHDDRDSQQLITGLGSLGINVSVDILLGVPRINGHKRNLQKELEDLLILNPQHISVYILTPKDDYHLIREMPEDETVASEYFLVHEMLSQARYVQYEISNYAKAGFESRHNWRYWSSDNVAALGPSATGYFQFQSNQACRIKWNELSFKPEMSVEWLGEAELKTERLFLGLRTRKGVSIDIFNKTEKLQSVLEKYISQGWITKREDNLCLTNHGMLMQDSIIIDLMHHVS